MGINRKASGRGNIPVIVLYSHTVGYAIIRTLGERGIPLVVLHYHPSEMGYCSRYVLEHRKVVHPGKDEGGFIEEVMRLADKYEGALVVPTDDYSVVATSKHKARLSQRFRVCVENWNIVRTFIIKQYTYDFAASYGIPCPMSFQPATREDIEKRVAQLQFPCLIKPCEGHIFYDYFRLKMFRVDSIDDLLARYEQCFEKGIEVMVQELIPGDDSQGVNYNSYFVNGNPVAEFTARKVRIDPPFFGSPRVLISQRIPEIIDPGRMLLKNIGYEGFSCMEFKRDVRSGEYKLMEINCRHNLTALLAPRCGINFPWIMYRHVAYGEIDQTEMDFEEGVYWIDLMKDIMRFFVSRSEEKYTIKQYIKPYLNRNIEAVLNFHDPAPFAKRTAYSIGKGLRSILRRSS